VLWPEIQRYLPLFYERVGIFKEELSGLSREEAVSRAHQVIHTIENRIQLILDQSSERTQHDTELEPIRWFISRAKDCVREVQNSSRDLTELGSTVDDLAGVLTKWANDKTTEHIAELQSRMMELAGQVNDGIESPSLSIVVDSDVDPELLAEFLAELSSIYSELSKGDELIVVEGKLPVGEEAFA
jgi:ElaB/YqjD/DUF883 family membrane-anchored ribosome-binding protein